MAAAHISGTRNVTEMLSHLENGSDFNLSPEAVSLLSRIPDGYIPLPHQIAGHRHTNGNEGSPFSECPRCFCGLFLS